MNASVSIVICTYNGSKRLPETLRHLAAQKVPSGIPWEVLVMDNASTDGTSETVLRHRDLFAAGSLRVISVPEPGKSNALTRAVREVRHEFLSIVDDDNWVGPDWVERIHTIFLRHPEISVCGGRCDAVYEIDPPAWFHEIQWACAVGRQFPFNGEVTHTTGALLWGAGMTMRTAAVRNLIARGFQFRFLGRTGNKLTSNEDAELCFALRETGCRFWYDDDLALKHFIPKERLEWSYPLRLMRGFGEGSVLVDLYLTALNRPPFRDRPSWKKGWIFAVLRTGRNLLLLVAGHPIDCLRQTVGSTAALNLQKACGQWTALWALRSRYTELHKEIANASWAQTKPGAQS